jgi:hypothetical protein
MKLAELKPNLADGKGIDLRKVHMVSKTMVAPGKLPNYDMKLLGITIGQKQSTGDTSKVTK